MSFNTWKTCSAERLLDRQLPFFFLPGAGSRLLQLALRLKRTKNRYSTTVLRHEVILTSSSVYPVARLPYLQSAYRPLGSVDG